MSKVNFKGSVMLNPTPVVLITSKNKEGKVNVFTVGWASTVCTKPPVMAIGIRPERLSYDYIKESMECVINLTTKDMVNITDYCGVISGKRQDKIEHFDLKLSEGVSINTPSLEMSPVALECRVRSITPLGTHDMFLLDITNVKVDESIIDEKNKIRFDMANLIAYSHGEYFGLESEALGSFGYSIRKNTNKGSQGGNSTNNTKITSNTTKENINKSDNTKSSKVSKKNSLANDTLKTNTSSKSRKSNTKKNKSADKNIQSSTSKKSSTSKREKFYSNITSNKKRKKQG